MGGQGGRSPPLRIKMILKKIKQGWYEYEFWNVFNILSTTRWNLWVSLTSHNWIHPKTLWKRFDWWIKSFMRIVNHRLDYYFVIAPQRRNVSHLHGVIGNVPESEDKELRMKLRDLWDVQWNKLPDKKECPGERRFALDILRAYRESEKMSFDWVKEYWFGSSRIFIFDKKFAGRLCKYLTKELVKNKLQNPYYKLSQEFENERISWKIRKLLASQEAIGRASESCSLNTEPGI